MNGKTLSIVGVITTVVGTIAKVAGDVVIKKQQDAKIAESAAKAVADMMAKKES